MLVLELAVGARVEQRLVPVVEAHEVRRPAVGAAHLEDLAVPVGLPDLLAVDDQAIADARLHGIPLRRVPAYAPW